MSWIDEISIQRRSFFSNGLIIQTDDCKRVEELILVMKAKYPKPIILAKQDDKTKKWNKERWLLLDGWEGLKELKYTDNVWTWKHIADAKKFGGEIRTLLPAISTELEKGETVLVIQNLLLADKNINNALRSWSTSNKLTAVTILVFVEDMSMFPQSVWSKMKIIDVPKSLEHERRSIILQQQKSLAIAEKYCLNDSEMKAAVQVCAGMTLDQIDAAVTESIVREYRVKLGRIAQIKAEMISKDPVVDIIQRPEFGFEAIGGYDMLKKRIKDDIILPIKHPIIAKVFHMAPPRGIIMFGPPGTGKTVLAKAISKELNTSVLVFRPENILSKYVGESEQAMKRAFKIADSMAPCCLLVDELDRLAKRGSGGGSDGGAQVHREIFSMFLEKLGDENRKWFFIGATNRIEDIDEAMRRTGRIDSIAPVPFPDKKARREIFKIHAITRRELPLTDDVSFKVLADNKYTYMWSGSDIEQLVVRTSKYVMKDSIKLGKPRDISMEDFETILNTFNIDVATNEKLQGNIKEQAKRLTNDTRLMSIFEEAQEPTEMSRGEKARGYRNSTLKGDAEDVNP